MPVAQSSGILAVIYLCPWVVSSNFVFFFKSRASCAHVKHVLPKCTMKSLSDTGEELCCVYSLGTVLYPILKPGSPNYTELWFKEYFERPQLVCENVSAQDEKEDTRTRHPNNSGRWKGLKHLHLVCVLACRSANHSFQKNPLRCSCNPHLKTAKEGLSRARLRWREFSAYWKMWFASGKLQLLSPEQNLGAAEWKPFQTGRTSHTTEILIFVKSFNEQQKAKEWDKVGAPDHSP